MTTTYEPQVLAAASRSRQRAPVTSTRGHIRGSVMLLLGRLTSMSLAFVTQVVMVRYLSKSDYGAFAYALSVVALLQSFLARPGPG